MSRRLVLLRHGETDWNAARRMQGQRNSQLSELGLSQASQVASVMGEFEPEVLWSSDLDRALRTAAAVGEACGLTAVADPRLREYSLGGLEGMTHDEFAEQDPDGFAAFRSADWAEIDEIESPEVVAQRFVSCLRDLADGLTPAGTGVAVAHGASIRTGLVAWLGWPAGAARDLGALQNCAWVELAERETGSWSLVAYNRTAR